MKQIVQKEAPVLRQLAKPVALGDIAKPKITTLLKDMREALSKETDGVGLAAPQLGVSLRIFIVADIVFKIRDDETDMTNDTLLKKESTKTVYINPEIISTSKDKKALEEGCLSVRPLFGKVRRATKVTIRAYDENGKAFERGASGLLAQIYQHEVDHLNGVLFIDKAKEVREMALPERALPENASAEPHHHA